MSTHDLLYCYPLLSSTSDQAEALLADRVKPPFGVIAQAQSQGRGQRGRTWASPPGGIYLTVVFPGSVLEGDAAPISLVPLKAAVLVARWIHQRFNLRITIKWPNDLLYAGRKLGGILCSTSMHGDECRAIYIGVGVNIAVTPEPGGEYRSLALTEIVGNDLDVDELARSCAEYMVEQLPRLSWSEAAEHYRRFSLGTGQLWCSPERTYYRETGISPQGELLLTSCDQDKTPKVVASAGQYFSWVLQDYRKGGFPLIVADIGNTDYKVAYFASAYAPEPSSVWRLPHGNEEKPDHAWHELRSLVSQGSDQRSLPLQWPIFCTEVNAPAFAAFSLAAEAAGFTAERLAPRPLLLKPLPFPLACFGLDRLANIEGWLSRLKPEERRSNTLRGLIISFGTATAVEVVDADGTYHGGLIVPGLDTALRSLHDYAHQLPRLRFRDAGMVVAQGVSPLLGNTTEAAMYLGVLHQSLGLIERLEREVSRGMGLAPKPCRLVLTGGFAALIARYVDDVDATVDPLLTLHGIRVLALGGYLSQT